MNHRTTATERRIAPEFGPQVTPPHRPGSLTARAREESGSWGIERSGLQESGPHGEQDALVAGERFSGESEYRIPQEATGYRTSPFITGTEGVS